MSNIHNNVNKTSFGMNPFAVCSNKCEPIGISGVGQNLKPLPNDIFVNNIKNINNTNIIGNIKERKQMNNEEKQVKLLNDYVNYDINFETLLQERERLRNNKDFGDDSVNESIENLFSNLDEDPDYTQTDFSYDARELINIYRKKGKYSNIIND